MSAPIPLGFGQVSLHWSVDGDPDDVLAVFGIEDDNTQTPDEIATAIWDAWTAQFDGSTFCNEGHFTGVTLVANRASVMVEGHDRATQDGSASFSSPSVAVTALLTKGTGLAGRKFRGRCFLPNIYLDEANVDQAGRIDSALVTTLGEAWQAFIDALNPLGIPMQVLHSDGVTAPTPVLGGHCEPYVATQRRRQRP